MTHVNNYTEKVSITHMSNEHSDWLRALDFYKQELTILKGRLTEIAGKNSDHEVLKQVEHYENQFRLQADNIDKLRHDIRTNVAHASLELQDAVVGYIDASILTRHNHQKERFAAEEKACNQLRHQFNEFASVWM